MTHEEYEDLEYELNVLFRELGRHVATPPTDDFDRRLRARTMTEILQRIELVQRAIAAGDAA